MAQYRATQKAETWTTFKKGVLSDKADPIQQGAAFFASVAGAQEHTGDTVLEINPSLFTKAKWCEVVAMVETPDEDENELPVPPEPMGEWRRYYIKHDWESGAVDPPFTVREVAPDPEVNRIGEMDNHKNHVKVKSTKAMHFFLADLIAMQRYGVLLRQCTVTQRKYVVQKASSLMGPGLFLFNRSQDAKVANYLKGENLTKAPPMMAALICGGNTVWGMPAGRNKNGREMVLIHSFLAHEALPIVSPDMLLDPRVIWATVIYRENSVGPFPHLQGLSVPYPLITFEPYYYPADGLEELSAGEVRSQYVPARGYYP